MTASENWQTVAADDDGDQGDRKVHGGQSESTDEYGDRRNQKRRGDRVTYEDARPSLLAEVPTSAVLLRRVACSMLLRAETSCLLVATFGRFFW